MSQLSKLCLSTLNVSGLRRDIHVQLHGAMLVGSLNIRINEVISVLPNHHGAIYMPYSCKLDTSIMNAMAPYPALLLLTPYQVAMVGNLYKYYLCRSYIVSSLRLPVK